MKKTYNPLFMLLLSLFFYTCTKNNGINNYKIIQKDGILIINNENCKKELKLNREPRLVLKIDNTFQIYVEESQYFDFDYSNNFYVLDLGKSLVYKFNSTGKMTKKFGGKGQGPGEFELGTSIFINKDTIFVSCLHERKVNKYTLDGEFIKTKHFVDRQTTPDHLKKIENGFVNKTEFIINRKGGKKYFLSFNILDDQLFQKSSIVSTTYDTSKYNDVNEYMWNPYTCSDSLIYIGVNSFNRLRINVFNINGKKIKEINRKYRKVKYPLVEISRRKGDAKKKNLYVPSILKMEIDQNENLWVFTMKNDFLGKILRPSYECNIYRNGINLGVLDVSFIPNVARSFIKKGKLITIEDEYIKIYEIPEIIE